MSNTRDDEITSGAAEDARKSRRGFGRRVEDFLGRLSTRNAFWNKVCSLIWLPYAFRSGISFRQLDKDTFTATLPFRRFNRNWYNAMAGAALLGNSEVAAGMYLFGECGADYIVICKEMHYRFLRPCFGPAIYHIVNSEDLKEKKAAGGEFNIKLELEIRQHVRKPKTRQRRVGRCFITFHCTPKEMYRGRKSTRPRTRRLEDGDLDDENELKPVAHEGNEPSSTSDQQNADLLVRK